MKLAPVQEAGLPPTAVQENVYGVVPPVAAALKVTEVPTVPEAGPVTVSAKGNGLIVMLAVLNAFAPLKSVTVAFTRYVPFTG